MFYFSIPLISRHSTERPSGKVEADQPSAEPQPEAVEDRLQEVARRDDGQPGVGALQAPRQRGM
jgi:hypothetical protein